MYHLVRASISINRNKGEKPLKQEGSRSFRSAFLRLGRVLNRNKKSELSVKDITKNSDFCFSFE